MRKMKQLKIIGIVLLIVFLSQSADLQRFSIDKTGRSIQVDAFLIEWSEEDSDTLDGGVFSFVWDAVNTPEGVAGYIWYILKDTCSLTVLRFYPQIHSKNKYMTIVMGAAASKPTFYAVEKSLKDDDTSVTAEWLIPWDSISIDSDGQYEITLAAFNSCDDAQKSVILSGKHHIEQSGSGKMTRRITFQVISIAVLLAIFLVLRSRARKLQKR